jgi:hypothetical protein
MDQLLRATIGGLPADITMRPVDISHDLLVASLIKHCELRPRVVNIMFWPNHGSGGLLPMLNRGR